MFGDRCLVMFDVCCLLVVGCLLLFGGLRAMSLVGVCCVLLCVCWLLVLYAG